MPPSSRQKADRKGRVAPDPSWLQWAKEEMLERNDGAAPVKNGEGGFFVAMRRSKPSLLYYLLDYLDETF